MTKCNCNVQTHVLLVVDKSGSMKSIAKETISGFNEHIDEIQKRVQNGQDVRVGLTVFDDKVEVKSINSLPDQVTKLCNHSYVPCSSTAMYDGIGFTLDALAKHVDLHDKNKAFLMIVLSDGYENASKEYNQATISEKIKSLEANGNWTFTYVGANQDIHAVRIAMGMSFGNVCRFDATTEGSTFSSKIRSASLNSYLDQTAKGITSVSNFYSESKTDEDRS